MAISCLAFVLLVPYSLLFPQASFCLVVSQKSCLNQTCGNNFNISYPFSLSPSCPSFSSDFQLQCTRNIFTGDILSLNTTVPGVSFPVLHIFNDSLVINISNFRSNCNTTSNSSGIVTRQSLRLPPPGPFVISGDNQFGSFGCNNLGIIVTSQNFSSSDEKVGGCLSLCSTDTTNAGLCSNRNCCVDSLSSSVRAAYYDIVPYDNCTGFSILFHKNYTDFETLFGLKLLWALPSTANTPDAVRTEEDYACSQNSSVTLVSAVPGYLCACQSGFHGDGYSNGSGCSDIDECKTGTHDCIPGRTTCKNTYGSYICSCKSRLLAGDGTIKGSGCKLLPTVRNALAITGGVVGGIIAVAVSVSLTVLWRRRTRRRYFKQNGGLQMEEFLDKSGKRSATKLFSVEELQLATDNFSDRRKLGTGGYGTVFKGTLKDGTDVAVKKANRSGESKDNEQFLNEVAILTQINHRYIVRLLGCCLETSTPLLVYEFLSNGTLMEHLAVQKHDDVGFLAWEKRLEIGIQTAEALAYLHAAASPPILHRDVKTANILLDDNLDAKVADFGVSRLIPEGEEHVSTAVQGTIGYLDPEYFQTLQLTEKSDVYSMGVVLVELVTGLRAVDNHGTEARFANLALLFVHKMATGDGEEVIDPQLFDKEACELQAATATSATTAAVVRTARLARQCLAMHGAQRPSMREVAEELRRVAKVYESARRNCSSIGGILCEDEAEPLLCQQEDDGEAGAVVATPAKDFYVQSSSNSSGTTFNVESLIPTTNSFSTPR